MATVLGGEFRYERRLPQGHEAVRLARGGETTEERVDKHGPAAGVDGDIMDVQIAVTYPTCGM